MFGLARLAAAVLVRVGAIFLLSVALVLPAAAVVTITGATPNTYSGPGETITFHFRLDQENAIVNSIALNMNYPVGAVTCSPALPIQPFETTNCTANYTTVANDSFGILQYGSYDLTTNGAPRGGSVAGRVTVAYVPPGAPSITSISPASGPSTGGTAVTITGTNFNSVTGVTIGGTALLNRTVVNATTITGTTPANTSGAKNVTVTTTAGSYTLSGGFTYVEPTIAVAPATLPSATASTAYTQTLTASGGTAPYTFSVAAGAMPAGLTLAPGGTLAGTPTSSGTFSFTIEAEDSNGFTGTRDYSLTVATPTISLTPTTLPGGTGGVTYSQTLTASGGAAPYGFATTAGALPPGMRLSSSGGITGTPTEDGTFNFTVAATDGNGFSGSRAYTLTIAAPAIAVAPSAPLTAVAGSAYAGYLSATGGTAPFGFAVSAGALPPGMRLSPDGQLAGTPTADGTFNFTVTVTDALGFTGTQALSLVVGAPTIVIAPATLPGGTGGASYAQAFSASGGAAPYDYAITAGTLPPGLNLSTTGMLSGTPTAAGSFGFTVTATDENGFRGARAYTLAIDAPEIVLAPSILPDGTGGAAYAENLSATGGTVPYSFAVTGGGLPAGLALAADGSLAGTPSEAGGFSIEITATDALGFKGTTTYSLTIAAPNIQLAPASLPQGVGGVAYGPAQLSASGGTAPFSFTVTAGALPAGLSLSADGALSGTPMEAGSFAITIEAEDSLGFTGSASYTLVIDAPVPVAPDRTVELLAGTTGRVSLTDGATGSPFTGAAIATQPPASAGTASIEGASGSYDLVFAAAETASGAIPITYTLSNDWGVSAPATITFNVAVRPDPSQDAEVIGLLTAQADSARRLATGQIGNFNDRLEQLHNEGDRRAGSIDLRIGLPQEDEPERLAYADEEEAGPRAYGFPIAAASGPSTGGEGRNADRLAYWTSGFVNFGVRGDGALDLDQTLAGVSAGVDWRFSPNFVGGIGIGYGRDAVDVGTNGTESDAQAFSAAVYGSYHPAAGVFLDGLLGFSRLEFDSRRFVSATGGFANGKRDGHQVFGSLSMGYEHRREELLLSPYARLQGSWSRLDGFTETGAGAYNLAFGDQDAEMVAGVLGLRMEYRMPTGWGTLVPRARLEYTHDFAGSSRASMGYADLSSGLPYALKIDPASRDYLSLQTGVDAELGSGWEIGFKYRFNLGLDGDGDNHAVGLNIGASF